LGHALYNEGVLLACVSVDLDELPNYFEIHGLSAPSADASGLVYDRAVARLLSLAEDGGFPLTLFAIARDLDRDAAASVLSAATGEGHEIANHSLDHRYDLARLGRAEIARQIGEGARRIEERVGVRPVGFRAPGYTITDEIFEVLSEQGVLYDASVFPCPAYWLAKAAAIGVIRARGRTSRSIVDTPNVLRAPTAPYRVGRPYWTRGNGVLEIPVQVTRGLRLPFIGTSVTLARSKGARRLARMCVGEPVVNLELHGIDVLDVHDGLHALARHQHDVRVERATKVEAILAATDELRRAGYTFVTMREAAARVAA
jgi:peptidoglycan-N-acetylglucosamine deacetylase